MQWERDLPGPSEAAGGVVVLEAVRGQSRRHVAEEWARAARDGGAEAWLLPCDLSESGLWAGVNSLMRELVKLADRHAPELLQEHAFSLVQVVPELNGRLEVPVNLTESSEGVEAVRNYAVDRAYRIPQGLIDFTDAVLRRAPVAPSRVIVCDDFDRAGVLGRHFFRELVRRRADALGLTLLLVVEPGGAASVLEKFAGVAAPRVVRLDLPRDASDGRSPAEMTALARELEAKVRTNLAGMVDHVPTLIRYLEQSERPEAACHWQAFLLGRYNHMGFYEDALRFADAVLENLDTIEAAGAVTRWNLVGSIFGCLVAIGEAERAHQVVLEEAWPKIFDPASRPRVCYIMAMLHARFLPQRDAAKAEHYLFEGLKLVDDPALTPEDRHFLRVFLNNGLALVRHRQGRPEEAVALCETGFDDLSENMEDEHHRLHRSVLLYNIAQVYTATGQYEKALEYFRATMEMDPNYSEYFNDRGNVLLKLGRFDEAMADYREAIALSPPYPEVWTNVGQCHRNMGQLDEAVAAFSRALDLEPRVVLARGARAQIFAGQGRTEEAMADFDVLLELNPAQPVVLANRAALRYCAGRIAESVEDLDRAIELSPEHPGFRRNRAVGLAELDRPEEAARDLEKFLELVPDAPDRAEVEERIAALQGQLAAA
jgi:tetratricopeptide (TPR) repeat protein